MRVATLEVLKMGLEDIKEQLKRDLDQYSEEYAEVLVNEELAGEELTFEDELKVASLLAQGTITHKLIKAVKEEIEEVSQAIKQCSNLEK